MAVNKAKKKTQGMTIARLRAMGKNCREIGKEVDLSHSQVALRLKDKDVSDRITGIVKYYASFDKEVQKGFMALVLDTDKDVRLKAVSEYHKVMGITSPHPSVLIQKIYQDNRVITYAPHIQAIINQQVDNSIEGEIIEER